MTSDVLIRRATAADWPALWPVWHEVVAAGDTYTYAPDTPPEVARRLWLPGPPAATWLAADEAGRVLGTYLLKPNQPGPGSHVANAGFMVSGAARGRGLGRVLAEHCLDRAREAGYRAMQFNAVVATNAGAIALWRALGFEVVGTVPGAFRHPAYGDVDLHVMHRELVRDAPIAWADPHKPEESS
ncbi:MAG TPA: GNAT family N-acetyltransferase [Mycobacteriales bacterium]|jgi:L-amino acid N-acyltransferase YncA|nr:GNAT family N-acetyltransferase [Mycobacteriales bacterium]